jgi:hypothetical protein
MFLKLRHKVRVLLSNAREKKKEKQRSPEWRHVRDKFLKENPTCAACGSSKKLQVHHKMPFHVNPHLELDPKNLITLCMDENECHLQIGHGDSWQCYNPCVEQDALKYMHSDYPHRGFLVEDIKAHRIHASKID